MHLDLRRKPQTQVRPVSPLDIKEGLVWTSDAPQGEHGTGTDRCWVGKLCFANLQFLPPSPTK